MDPQKKDDIFRNPRMDVPYFGRRMSSALIDDALYTTVQSGEGRKTRPLVFTGGTVAARTLLRGEACGIHQPVMIEGADTPGRGLLACWNEYTDRGWKIRAAGPGEDGGLSRSVTVHSTGCPCLPPSACVHEGRIFIVWPEIQKGDIILNSAEAGLETPREWKLKPLPLPERAGNEGLHLMRPCIASGGGRLFLAWDRYAQGRYRIEAAEYHDGTWSLLGEAGTEGEWWTDAKLSVDSRGRAWMCWTAGRNVIDKLGIMDHEDFAMAACIDDGEFTILRDEQNTEDDRIIGDLREGLLAGSIYKGHVGLRRNPRITVDEKDTVRLFWENREEKPDSDVYGRLAGRQYLGGGCWSQAQLYSEAGYSYSVPPKIKDGLLRFSYYFFETSGSDVLRSAEVGLGSASPYRIDSRKWRRWHPLPKDGARIDGGQGGPATIGGTASGGSGYRLFWADTHCHSVWSPDAEGEPDELIHYARDTAGLDAVAVVDNDYYPHKALTEAEWKLQNIFAEFYSKSGVFTVFPAYEYTFHRTDLEPDYNHRCILYPHYRGPLIRRIDPEGKQEEALLRKLKQAGGTAYPHHCSYKMIDESAEWNVEVCSSWRVCLEETDITQKKLSAGQRTGFIGSSDSHRRVPGNGGALTGLYAKSSRPEDLFEAYRKRRTVASQGFPITIDFYAGGHFIGEEGRCRAGEVIISGGVRALSPIDYIEIIRDGGPIWWDSPEGCETQFEITDSGQGEGRHYYYLTVKLIGDPSLNAAGDPACTTRKSFTQDSRYPHNLARARGVFAWTSPVWITVEK